MSRFTLITYKGERPPRNKVMNRPLPAPLLTFLSSLVSNCKRLIAHGIVTDVAFDDYGRKVLDDFSDRCDGEIKGITDEGVRQMWNRAHLKAQRIAAVLATADNDKLPIIRKVHCDWGIGCVLRDIDQMKTEMKEGNVGDGDDARVTKLVSVIRSYINVRPAPSYKISNDMWKAGVIPRAYLQIKLQKSPAYVKHRMGSANALNSAIKEAILNGYIIEVDKTKLAMEYKKSGVAYRMVELPE